MNRAEVVAAIRETAAAVADNMDTTMSDYRGVIWAAEVLQAEVVFSSLAGSEPHEALNYIRELVGDAEQSSMPEEEIERIRLAHAEACRLFHRPLPPEGEWHRPLTADDIVARAAVEHAILGEGPYGHEHPLGVIGGEA